MLDSKENSCKSLDGNHREVDYNCLLLQALC
jgi:hypothetical protein